VSELEKLFFVLWILQNVEIWMFSFKMSPQALLLRNGYSVFTHHAYDATFIHYKTPLLCPLLLKHLVHSFWLPFPRFTCVSHEGYLESERFHIKRRTFSTCYVTDQHCGVSQALFFNFLNNRTHTEQNRLIRNYKLRASWDNWFTMLRLEAKIHFIWSQNS